MVTSQTRNRSDWLSIAAFLAPLEAQALRAFARRVGAAAPAAPLQPLPDGNHGETFNEAQA